MKTKLAALALLAGSSMFAQARFAVGIQVGGYDQGYSEPAPVYAAQPPCPSPDYGWEEGYWSQDYGRRSWIPGYWARQRYERPRYEYRWRDNERRENFGRRDEGRGRYNDRREDFGRRDYGRYGNGFRGR